jgi:hypothetical protein
LIIQIPPFSRKWLIYRENTYKCSPLVTKWQIILHFHFCFNDKYTPYFLGSYNKIFKPVNLVFLFLSMQYIRLTTYCHIFVKQLMTDFCLFQSHLLSQTNMGQCVIIIDLFSMELYTCEQ